MVVPEPASLPIIGQTPLGSSPLLPLFPALRSPSFLPESLAPILFETNWLYWIGGIALAVVLLHLGRTRADKTLFRIGVAAAAATALWILLALLVVTPEERLRDAHTTLAQAAEKADVDKILSFLAPDFRSTALGITIPAAAHDEIAARLKSYDLRDNYITEYKSDFTGQTAATRLTIITTTANGTVKTSWQLFWEDRPDSDWKINQADLLGVNGQSINTIPR